jgi:hypothetical protein
MLRRSMPFAGVIILRAARFNLRRRARAKKFDESLKRRGASGSSPAFPRGFLEIINATRCDGIVTSA